MHRSPFGILDSAIGRRDNNAQVNNRPKSANGASTTCPVTSFTEMAKDNYKGYVNGMPIVDTGTGRVRPRSAGAVRNPNRLFSNNNKKPNAESEYDHIDHLTGSFSKTHLKSSDLSLPQTAQCPRCEVEENARSEPNKDSKKQKSVKVINNVQLSQEDWEKIFAKYNLTGIDDVRFNFLRKGTGSTTKLDYLGKKQLEKGLTKQSASTNPETNFEGVHSEKDMVHQISHNFFPSLSIQHNIMHPSNSVPDENRHLREFSRKKKKEDEEFAQLLEKELFVETQHIQRCIQECNEFCEYLHKDYTYSYRDHRSVRKTFNTNGATYIDGSSSVRVITMDKFHAEHSELLKEFKIFSKYHPRHSLDKTNPPDSSHFIGVDDLFQHARKLEGESELKKQSKRIDDEDPYNPTIVHYNELRRRNETIALQLQIMQEYDDLQHMLTSQLTEMQHKGWNLHYKILFLSNFS